MKVAVMLRVVVDTDVPGAATADDLCDRVIMGRGVVSVATMKFRADAGGGMWVPDKEIPNETR